MWLHSQTCSGSAATIAAATGRPRTAQQVSCRPWVQTRASGPAYGSPGASHGRDQLRLVDERVRADRLVPRARVDTEPAAHRAGDGHSFGRGAPCGAPRPADEHHTHRSPPWTRPRSLPPPPSGSPTARAGSGPMAPDARSGTSGPQAVRCLPAGPGRRRRRTSSAARARPASFVSGRHQHALPKQAAHQDDLVGLVHAREATHGAGPPARQRTHRGLGGGRQCDLPIGQDENDVLAVGGRAGTADLRGAALRRRRRGAR